MRKSVKIEDINLNNKVSIRKQKATKCNKKVSVNTGTFFVQSRLSYFQVLGFAHLWSEKLNLRQIKCQLEIGSDVEAYLDVLFLHENFYI